MIKFQQHKIIKQFTGFSLIGIVITLLSLGASFLCLTVFRTPLFITYICIYGFSIYLSYLLNARLVFKVEYVFKDKVIYFVIYLSSMFLGLILLYIFKKIFPWSDIILTYIVIPFTLFWNFYFSKILFSQKRTSN